MVRIPYASKKYRQQHDRRRYGVQDQHGMRRIIRNEKTIQNQGKEKAYDYQAHIRDRGFIPIYHELCHEVSHTQGNAHHREQMYPDAVLFIYLVLIDRKCFIHKPFPQLSNHNYLFG